MNGYKVAIFIDAFEGVLRDQFERHSDLKVIYSKDEIWTNLMLGHKFIEKYIEKNGATKSIISKVGRQMFSEKYGYVKEGKLEQYKEYYRVDYTFWENYKESMKFDNEGSTSETLKNLEMHCSDLLLAFEHENNHKSWTDEFVKLFFVDAKLRVVMGYCDQLTDNYNSNNNDITNYINNDNNIRFVISTLNKITDKIGKTINGEYLVILAPRSKDFVNDKITIDNIIKKTKYFKYQKDAADKWVLLDRSCDNK